MGRHGDHEAHTHSLRFLATCLPCWTRPNLCVSLRQLSIQRLFASVLSRAANDAGRLRTLITRARTTGGLTARGGSPVIGRIADKNASLRIWRCDNACAAVLYAEGRRPAHVIFADDFYICVFELELR